MSEQEFSPGGSAMYSYDDFKPKGFEMAVGGENMEDISNHIEKYVGEIESVYHELISDKVHIDVHWVKPSAAYPFHVLVTSGMSDKPMTVPEGFEEYRYAELCVILPADWKLDSDLKESEPSPFDDEENYWPIRWLKLIARFPHEYDTWMGWGHTMPNGRTAEPFADNTKLGCMLLMPAIDLPEEFAQLEINEDKTIHFYALYPLYKEEMDYKLQEGTNALIEKFEEFGIRSIIDIDRPNTCKKKSFLGLF
jgi:hypothetical protein